MDNITISTWNVHGKGSPEEVDKLLSQSSKQKSEQQPSHIVCVQQSNLPPSGEETQNYKWLCLGKFGSAVLINKASTLTAGSVEQVCENICVAEVVTDGGIVMKVISCYIPPSTEYVTRDLWPKLVEVMKTIPCNIIYVLAGDFNAEIGKDDVIPSGVFKYMIGPKLCHKISNENGMQLKKIILNFHGTVANTFGEPLSKDPCHTYKYGNEKSQHSFIIVPFDRVLNFKVLLQESKFSWYPDYKSAVVSKSLRFTLFEKLAYLKSSPVTVSSWNVQGASPSAVDKALVELNLSVVCVQGVFLTSDNDLETDNYTWFTSKKLWSKNVGILIKRGSNILMNDFEAVSDSLCVGNVTMNDNKIKVVCCGLPSHLETAKFQEVTSNLTDLVKNIPEETYFVVAGDFNTNVKYTIIDVMVLYDQGDGNAIFLKKLMKECKVELPYTQKITITQISEKVRRNSSMVLMSPSCMMRYAHKHNVRWVPFFENGIVTFCLTESDGDPTSTNHPDSEVKAKELNSKKESECGKVENVNGFTYVTTRFYRMKRYFSINSTEQQAYRFMTNEAVARLKLVEKTDLPKEIVAKYKNTPPTLDELLRILSDGFTLFYGFLKESTVPRGCAGVLTASFENLNRGPFLIECIDIFEENTRVLVKRLIKFRWNGIVVYQQEGGKYLTFKRIINKGQVDFLSILGQHCFTVRARASFYNDCLAPQCKDKNKLNKVIRVMKRSDFPSTATAEDMKILINDLIYRDPQRELVFGPDFSTQRYLDPIKKYALSRNLGLRVFKSKKDLDRFDHISIFVNLTPQEIRKSLMAIPEHQDLRFQLIPPSGTDKDYFDWIAQWVEKVIPDEYFKPFEKIVIKTETCSSNTETKTKKNVSSSNLEDGSNSERKKRSLGFVEKEVKNVGNQTQHRIMKCTSIRSGNATVRLPKGMKNWVALARGESDLPKDVVDKFCETPPSQKELHRILGDDFTLYYGFGRESSVTSSTIDVLAESFEPLNRGGVMYENIEVLQRGMVSSHLIKIKWNGICIHQEEGEVGESFKSISQKGQAALIDKLGQHFYAVKAKISYYNNGNLPVCEDKEKLAEAIKNVDKSEFTSPVEIEAVKNYISEFFSKDSDVELVFGPEFSLNESLDPLRKFVMDKDLAYRRLKSQESLTTFDSFGFFMKRSPLEVRDRLMKIPDHQDLKFFLVPPCEFFNKSHYEWIKSWAAENFIEEYKLIFEMDKKTPPAPSVTQKPKEGTEKRKRKRKLMDNYRENLRSQPSRPAGRNQLSQRQMDYRWDNSRSQLSRSTARDQQVWLKEEDYYNRDNIISSQPPRSERNPQVWMQEEDYYRDNMYSQPARTDDYNISAWFGDQDTRADSGSRKRAWDEMDYYRENAHPQPSRSDDYDNYRSGSQKWNQKGTNQASERYVPASKRARAETSSRVEKPRWDDLAPLVIVWPISVRSEQERDPRKVLEANFPTEISLEANNRVAVHVSLPLRNRRNKTYCLCVGNNVYNATKTALDMLVKRGSVIKNTPTFLPPDGLVPNFIRYNIPCQTNPRTYIILSYQDTGPLTESRVIELFESFKSSLNEDLFFDKNYYSHEMKQLLLELAPKYDLKARHFGVDHRLLDRYVCVYKTKSKTEVLEEVLKMRDFHPKYRLVTNKLPPRLALNVF